MTLVAQLENVGRIYYPDDGPVLDGVCFSLAAGETVAVMGPSGSGKTTLLRLLGTLDRPDRGRVYVDGQDTSCLSEDELANVRNRKIGFVFQDHKLLPQLNALENVLLPSLAGFVELSANDARQRAAALLERVGLRGLERRFPSQLSGGQCQRVAVARALMNHPQLLLCDEPTGSLDHGNAVRLAELLECLAREEGTSLVLATHAAELAARCRGRFVLRDGKLAQA